MMAHKHLRELLSEDQEPFVLKNYIDERRCQLKTSLPRTHLQVKRRKPIPENLSFPGNLCKNACFFSFHDSPDVLKSPLFDFSSPLKSPCRNSNTLSFHIPARTAAILVEAALRIQRQSATSKSKRPNKGPGFGFFGSILKRITLRKGNRKTEIKGDKIRASMKNISKSGSSNGRKIFTEERRENPEKTEALEAKRVSDVGFSCSCNSRLSSAWSESNEDKSEDLETTSSRSEDSEEMEFVVDETKNGDFNSCEKEFCSSLFQFVLKECPSPGRRTPDFNTPATSPSRYRKEVTEREEGSLGCVGKGCDEEEKKQCSPVSVLEAPYNDDDTGGDCSSHHGQDDGYQGEEEHSLELEPSFVIVQGSKQQLLHKLRRFERLAELNSIDFEKIILEDDDDNEDEDKDEDEDDAAADDDQEVYVDNDESVSPDDEGNDCGLVREFLSQFNLCNIRRMPKDMKRLILDLFSEEARQGAVLDDREEVLNKIYKKFESWREVDSYTINMMVDLELRRDGDEWWRYQEQMRETAGEIELAIFGFLVQELTDELC